MSSSNLRTSAGTVTVTNGISVDVEDWYQGIPAIPFRNWDRYECRLAIGLERVLELFASNNVTATFFVLGYNSEHYPNIIKLISQSGHELATHGYDHASLVRQSPHQFQRSLRRSIEVTEDISDQPVIGHRAPYFSIGPATPWAVDILIDEGLTYDSSIYPIRHYNYGWPGGPTGICRFSRPHGSIIELPLPTVGMGNFRLPAAGGGYQRLLPSTYTLAALTYLNAVGQSFVIYLHPWELDPAHPRLPTRQILRAWPHYINLKNTYKRYDAVLKRFDFAPLSDLVPTDALSSVPEVLCEG